MAKQERRVNKRFVTFLTIGLMVVLTIIIAVMIIATSRKDPQVFVDRAERALAKKDYREAAKNYGSAFRYSQKDPKYLVMMAEAQYQEGDERKALGSLHTAVTSAQMMTGSPTLVAAQKRLLEIYFELIGRNGIASTMKTMEDEAEKLIKMVPEKDSGGNPELKKALALGYHVRGVCRFARRDEDSGLEAQALSDIQKALALDMNVEFVHSLVMITLSGTSQVMQAVQSEGLSPESYDEQIGKVEANFGRAERMYQDLKEAQKDRSEVYVALGNFYFQLWGGAEASLEMLCRGREQRIRSAIQHGRQEMEALEKSTTVSDENKRKGRQKIQNQITNLEREIKAWKVRSAKHREQTRKIRERSLPYYQKGVELAKTGTEKSTSLVALGNYYLGLNDAVTSEKIFRQAIAGDETSYLPYRILAEILRRRPGRAKDGKPVSRREEAISLLENRVYKIPTSFEGQKGRQNRLMRFELMLSLVDLYLEQNQKDDLKKVDEIFKELESTELAKTPGVSLARARRALAGNDPGEALRLLEETDSVTGGRNSQVKFTMAELYLWKGEVGAARKELENGLGLSPDSQVGWRLALRVYEKVGEAGKMLDYAERMLSEAGTSKDPEALQAKMKCLVRMNRIEEADAIWKSLPESAKGKLDWPREKAKILLAQGKTQTGDQLLRDILAKSPGDKQASIALMQSLLEQKRMAECRQVAKAALAKNPNDSDLKVLMSVVAIDDEAQRNARALEAAKELTKLKLEESRVKAAAEKDPFLRALKEYEVYARSNDLTKAKACLDEAVKLDPKKGQPINLRFAISTKDWDRARKSCDQVKVGDLDGVGGLTCEAELANGRGWDLVNQSMAAKTEEERVRKREEAKTYFEQSMTACEQAMKSMPKDSQLYALLGEAYYWLDRKGEADAALTKATELNPNNAYGLRGKAVQQWERIEAAGGLASEDLVQEFVQTVQVAAQQIPWDEWLRGRMAFIQDQMKKAAESHADESDDPAKVVARREAARKAKPEDVDNLLRLARIYEERKEVRDLAKSEACYRQALERNPTAEMIQGYLGFAMRTRQVEGMDKYLRDFAAREAKSGRSAGHSLLGYFYLTTGRAKAAESAFLDAVKVEDIPAKRLDVSVFYGRVGDPSKTATWARKTLEAKTNPQQERSARALLINSLLMMNRWNEAKTEIEAYQKIDKGPEGKIFEARLAIGQSRMSDAERALNGVLDRNAEHLEALNYRSLVYMFTWKLDKALADLETMQKSNAEAFGVPGRIKLVKLQCELGRMQDAENSARALISQVMEKSPDNLERIRVELLPALASALVEKNYEELLLWAGNLMQGYWGWPFERGQYFLTREKYAQAEQAFSQSWRTVADNAKAPVNLKLVILDGYLRAMFRSGNHGVLISTAQQAIKGLPEKVVSGLLAWQGAATWAKGDHSQGLALFRKALSLLNGNPMMVWQITRNTMQKAVAPRDLAAALEQALGSGGSPAERVSLACSYFGADAVGKGADLYRKLIGEAKEKKDKVALMYLLAQEYSQKHQYDQGAAVLREAKDLEPSNMAVLNNLAYIYEEYLNKPEEAMKLMDECYPLASSNPDVLDTYGQVLAKTGRGAEAMVAVARSVWTRESSSSRFHLGRLLKEQNQKRDAELQFRRALQLVGEDKELTKQIQDAMGKPR